MKFVCSCVEYRILFLLIFLGIMHFFFFWLKETRELDCVLHQSCIIMYISFHYILYLTLTCPLCIIVFTHPVVSLVVKMKRYCLACLFSMHLTWPRNINPFSLSYFLCLALWWRVQGNGMVNMFCAEIFFLFYFLNLGSMVHFWYLTEIC